MVKERISNKIYVVQRSLFRPADLCHKLVRDGLQELRLVVLGADKVS